MKSPEPETRTVTEGFQRINDMMYGNAPQTYLGKAKMAIAVRRLDDAWMRYDVD